MPPGFAADVVLAAGKPVLIVPYAGHFPQVGLRPFVAWNEKREAARALTDAAALKADEARRHQLRGDSAHSPH